MATRSGEIRTSGRSAEPSADATHLPHHRAGPDREMKVQAARWMQSAHKNAGWLIAFGIVEIVLGLFVTVSPLAGGLAVTLILGAVLLIGGVVRLFTAFAADSFGSGTLTFLWGLLLASVGFYILTNPGLGLATLTVALSMMFFIAGLIQSVVAAQMRPVTGWGWMLTGGIVGIVLAVLVWTQFPISGLWFVGTLVGVNLLFNGLTTVSVGGAARKLTVGAEGV